MCLRPSVISCQEHCELSKLLLSSLNSFMKVNACLFNSPIVINSLKLIPFSLKTSTAQPATKVTQYYFVFSGYPCRHSLCHVTKMLHCCKLCTCLESYACHVCLVVDFFQELAVLIIEHYASCVVVVFFVSKCLNEFSHVVTYSLMNKDLETCTFSVALGFFRVGAGTSSDVSHSGCSLNFFVTFADY